MGKQFKVPVNNRNENYLFNNVIYTSLNIKSLLKCVNTLNCSFTNMFNQVIFKILLILHTHCWKATECPKQKPTSPAFQPIGPCYSLQLNVSIHNEWRESGSHIHLLSPVGSHSKLAEVWMQMKPAIRFLSPLF